MTYFIWLEALALHAMFPEGQHAVLKAHCKAGTQSHPIPCSPAFPVPLEKPSGSGKTNTAKQSTAGCWKWHITWIITVTSKQMNDGKWEFSIQGHRAASSEWFNSVILRVYYSRKSCLTATIQLLKDSCPSLETEAWELHSNIITLTIKKNGCAITWNKIWTFRRLTQIYVLLNHFFLPTFCSHCYGNDQKPVRLSTVNS